MVVNNQTARQLTLELSPASAVQMRPAQMRASASIQNKAQLRMETEEFLLSKMNSSFNSFLSLFEKARPECGKGLRDELCRIFSARTEGEKAILEKFPSDAQMKEARQLIHIPEFSYDFRKNKKEDNWKWRFTPGISKEEQNIKYALECSSAMNLIAGLHSLLETREYKDFVLVLDLYEKHATESARKPRQYGKPRVSGYEVLLCNELQREISRKVKQLAETGDKN
jgi:hypothetical protein